MKTLKVTLKQHTPLIHFQHDQEGATLRASEVKPKLDRYIIENVFNNDYEKCKHFLVGYKKSDKKNVEEKEKAELYLNRDLENKFKRHGFKALNYKIRIRDIRKDEEICLMNNPPKSKYNRTTRRTEIIYSTETFPLILSNMGGKSREEELVNFSFSECVELNFIFLYKEIVDSKDLDLCDTIRKQITYFFANTNFGQRSNKGFGSFTVDKIDDVNISWKHIELYEHDTQLMKYDVDNVGYEKIKKLFGVIDFYWKCLKSGVNGTKREIISEEKVSRAKKDRYIKSYLWTFLDTKGYTWEKRKIKNELNLESFPAEGDHSITVNSKPPFFARAHLGCPINGFSYKIPKGIFDRGVDGEIINDRRGHKKEQEEKVEVVIHNDNQHEIERIASPIIFKPVFHSVKGKDGTMKSIAYIYILYDKQVIEALRTAPDTQFSFARDNGLNTTLPLFLKDAKGNRILLDYHGLIKQFHQSLGFKMVVRNFGWQNLLEDKEVLFQRIVK